MSTVIVKSQYTAAELTAMLLPGLPTSKVSIIALADRQNWNYTEVSGRGGLRREYTPPAEVMELIRHAATKQFAATITPQNMPVVAPQSSFAHTEAQNLTADARKGVLDALNAVMQRTGYPLKRAAKYLIDIARNGDASPQLVAMLKLARDGRGRSSDDGLPSDRSLTRFVEYQKTASLVSIPAAQNNEPVLVATKTPVKTDAIAVNRVALKAQDNPQAPLQQRAEQENDDAWSQVIDHVQQLVAEAPDLPTLQNQLLAAYSGLPLEDLQSVMAQGFALAQLAGMFDVKTGQ
ncbi:DNA-binding protein [Undibacterium sp. CY21W]|uniref:DNA-binding protein n=1 Tax=Undibacterium sp. CY21W TaxID=2762293 RepID=UPI00164C68A6|nr:DNA-binding protein [Undibacterium sp. CY21W]MBC3928993.1 hypothetical protein [Undibacterium sp. CY21W]